MASNNKQAGSGWTFNLDKLANKDNLKDPLGFKCSTTDIMVKSSGKKNLTQIEVLENVIND